MYPLYIIEQGVIVKKSSQRLVLAKDNKTIKELPIIKINRVVIFGNIQITTQAITFLLDNGVDVHYLSLHGKLKGTLSSQVSKNIFLKLAQYDRFRDNLFKIDISRQIVQSKLRNQKAILQRYQRNHSEVDFARQIFTLEKLINDLSKRENIEELMGCEGAGSAAYFNAFNLMTSRDLKFEKRIFHPSPDPVNALLSLGYTMITNEVYSLLLSASFDPLLGFLHGLRYGRNSLALDIVEEFRQPLIDRFTLNLINNRIINKDDFDKMPDGGLFLKQEILKKYLTLFEEKMKEDVEIEENKKITWMELISYQINKLEKAVLKKEIYEPYVTKE